MINIVVNKISTLGKMASNFKRIRFFESDQIEDINAVKAQTLKNAKSDPKAAQVMESKERTI
jgi:hypothetical protein